MSTEPGIRAESPASGRRVLRLVATHRFFAVILGMGIVLRVAVMLAFRPAMPLRNNDAYQYLFRSITLSPQDSFHPFLYAVLIKPMVLLGDLTWLVLTQHAAALAMAVLLYLLLLRLGLRPGWAALATAPLLLDGFQLNIEHQVLSETFFQLFVVSALVLLAWRARPSVGAAGAAGALIGLSTLVRFAGLAVIVAALLFTVVRRVGWIRVATMLACFLLTLFTYALWFQSQTGTFGITNRNGFFLYGRVASFADCREVPVPENLQVFCAGLPARGGLFKSKLPVEVRRDPAYNEKALAFAKRMIRANPASYLGAVLADFTRSFSPAPKDSLTWRFPRHLTPKDQRRVPPSFEVTFRVREGLAAFLRGYQAVMWLFGPLLALLLAAGLAGGAAGMVRARDRSLAPEAWLFALSAVGLLLFPPVFAVYHFRYVLPALPLAGPAAALGMAAAAARSRPGPGATPGRR